MLMRCNIALGLFVIVGLLMAATHTFGAEPVRCLEAIDEAETVAKKAAESGQKAMEAVEVARAEGTLEAARKARKAAHATRDAAKEARDVASHARSMGCLGAAERAEGAAREADRVAKEAEEDVARIVKLLEGLKPVFLDPGTSEAERYQQEKEVSPSQ